MMNLNDYSRGLWTAIIGVVLGLSIVATAGAAYNTNITGTLTYLSAYEGGVVMFELNNQPASNGSCNPTQFEIDPANNTDAVLGRMYARLLLAYSTQQPVNVGYDNSGSCGTKGYIHVYEVG
jgi:hypothetical protein